MSWTWPMRRLEGDQCSETRMTIACRPPRQRLSLLSFLSSSRPALADTDARGRRAAICEHFSRRKGIAAVKAERLQNVCSSFHGLGKERFSYAGSGERKGRVRVCVCVCVCVCTDGVSIECEKARQRSTVRRGSKGDRERERARGRERECVCLWCA